MAANCSPETPEEISASAETGPKSLTEENTPGRVRVGRGNKMVGPAAEKMIRKIRRNTTIKHPR
jgi:hypothetical protein